MLVKFSCSTWLFIWRQYHKLDTSSDGGPLHKRRIRHASETNPLFFPYWIVKLLHVCHLYGYSVVQVYAFSLWIECYSVPTEIDLNLPSMIQAAAKSIICCIFFPKPHLMERLLRYPLAPCKLVAYIAYGTSEVNVKSHVMYPKWHANKEKNMKSLTKPMKINIWNQHHEKRSVLSCWHMYKTKHYVFCWNLQTSFPVQISWCTVAY